MISGLRQDSNELPTLTKRGPKQSTVHRAAHLISYLKSLGRN